MLALSRNFQIVSLLFLCTLGCVSGCAGRIPLPEAARHLDATAVIERVRAKRSTCQQYSAEVRLQYFGGKGRYKGTAQLFARRPDHLRYDLHGPHGGVLAAFATDGQRLMALDMGANRMTEGRALAEHFDALLPLAPLGLDATGWVALMFGEFDIADEATLTYDDSVGLFWLRWQRGVYDIRLGVAPQSFDVREAQGHVHGVEQWHAVLGVRDRNGLPTTLRLTAPTSDTDIELRWRDVDTDHTLVDAIFVLPRPKRVAVQNLEMSPPAATH